MVFSGVIGSLGSSIVWVLQVGLIMGLSVGWGLRHRLLGGGGGSGVVHG